MIGDCYWTTGVMLIPFGDGYWGVKISFHDDGFAQPASTEGALGAPNPWEPGAGAAEPPRIGELRSRYVSRDPVEATGVLLGDARRLGIVWAGVPSVYVPGDGEWEDVPLPPGWEAVVGAVEASLEADPVLALRRGRR